MVRDKDSDKRLALIAENLLDSLRQMRQKCVTTETNEYAKRVARRMLDRNDPRTFPCKHLAVLVVDAIDRGCPQEYVESFAHELLAEIRFIYTMKEGEKSESIAEVHKYEEHIEGLAEEAEIDFVHDPCERTARTVVERKVAQNLSNERFIDALNQQIRTGMHS